MPKLNKQRILAGRQAAEAYRTAHAKLYKKGWHKDIPEEHIPLLMTLVDALDGLGFTSVETDFEPKKTEILAKFEADSNLLNIQELGFTDREDFRIRATDADKEARRKSWN